MNNTTIKVVLDGRVLSDGNQGIYLRITKARKTKKINLGIKCEGRFFHEGELKRGHPNFQIDNELISTKKSKALQIVRESQLSNENISLDEFEKKFRGLDRVGNVFYNDFSLAIEKELIRAGKTGTRKAYADTRRSILKYKPNLKFEDITSELLEKYEVHLRETNYTTGGIAFRMRHIRALFNKAIQRERVKKEFYPFDRYKVAKLKPAPQKIALSIEEIRKLRDLDLSEKLELQEAQDYFLVSFYARGMNFHDIMLLKKTDIRNGRLYYSRSKTKRRLNLEIMKPLQDIINKYSFNSKSIYVFPILQSNHLTPQQIENRKHKVLGRYNAKLKTIATLAQVDKNLTSYVARHSFASIQKKLGTSIEKISEMMGHKDVSITMVYLKEFSNEELDDVNNKLLEI